MDCERLRASAEERDGLLVRHAGENQDVDTLHRMLEPLLTAARSGMIDTPVLWADVPGERPYMGGEYEHFPDVEEAYARFKVLATASEQVVDWDPRGGRSVT